MFENAGVVWSGALRQQKKEIDAEGRNTAEERPKEGSKLRPEDLASMDLYELKAELRRRGDVHPRGDVRRLRAALEHDSDRERVVGDKARHAAAVLWRVDGDRSRMSGLDADTHRISQSVRCDYVGNRRCREKTNSNASTDSKSGDRRGFPFYNT